MANIIAKIFNKDGKEIKTITADEVELEALCAYRDNLIVSDDYETLVTQSKLKLVYMLIDDCKEKFNQ